MIVKICAKHGELRDEDCVKEKSKQYDCGYYLRCGKCYLERVAKLKVEMAFKRTLPGFKDKKNADFRKRYASNKEKYRKKFQDYRDERKKIEPGHRYKEVIHKHGITYDDYTKMVEEQNNLCAICSMPETRRNPKNSQEICRLVIDHCHKTNVVRGLLCHACNTAIGKFHDDPETMLNAIAYVDFWNEKNKNG